MNGNHYDAVIVGARVSGAATGLLLTRAGARVLIVDRDVAIGDTLSTHALTRPAVELLSAWGLLDALLDAGTPTVREALFQYGADRVTVPIRSSEAIPGLCAPRRWLLDRTLLDAAVAAGADLSLGTTVEACLFDTGGRIAGVSLRGRDGALRRIRADLVIGADGRASRVAELVGAPLRAISPHRTATTFGYFAGIPNRGYRWFFGAGVTGGAIPTNDGLHCVFAACRPEEYKARFAADAQAGLRDIIGQFDPDLAERLRTEPAERLRRFPGVPGHIRQRAGHRWALVGDAACFKDPATAHGITDALLDAHHLCAALAGGAGLEGYEARRHAEAAELFETTQRIASLDWNFESLAGLHADLSECLKREHVGLSAGAGSPSLDRTPRLGRGAAPSSPHPRSGRSTPRLSAPNETANAF